MRPEQESPGGMHRLFLTAMHRPRRREQVDGQQARCPLCRAPLHVIQASARPEFRCSCQQEVARAA